LFDEESFVVETNKKGENRKDNEHTYERDSVVELIGTHVWRMVAEGRMLVFATDAVLLAVTK